MRLLRLPQPLADRPPVAVTLRPEHLPDSEEQDRAVVHRAQHLRHLAPSVDEPHRALRHAKCVETPPPLVPPLERLPRLLQWEREHPLFAVQARAP